MNAILTALAEALTILDRFAAANSSAEAIVAVVKLMLGRVRTAAEALVAELEELRAKAEVEREKAKVRMRARRSRTFANVREQVDATSSRAGSSSSYLEESKVDDDDDPRARFSKKTAEEVASEAEQIVKSNGKWPELPSTGWNRSAVVAQIDQRIKQGVQPQLIIDAVLTAAPRATAVIQSFAFFNRPGGPIEQAHCEATAQRSLPLMRAIEGGKGTSGRGTSHGNDYLKRRIAAAKQAEAPDGVGSVGGNPAADLPMDPAETG